MRYSPQMLEIMGLSLLTGAALLFLSIAAGPWALYLGAAVFGVGLFCLGALLVSMLLGR